MILRKKYFSLVEVIVAMSLTMILIVLLLSSYMQIEKLNVALDKEQNAAFKKLYLSTRLAAIFPKTIAVNDVHKDYIFYSSLANDSISKPGTQVLMFTFDNGPQLNPSFSDHVLGRLYLNQHNQLCLAIWPSPSRWKGIEIPPMKNEVLFEGIEGMTMQFYAPPLRDRKQILSNRDTALKIMDVLKLGNLGEWRNEWQQEYGDLPPLFKIMLTPLSQEASPITLVYPLPKSHFIIVYELN